MLTLFVKRRWWLAQKRLISSIGMALLLPIILHLSITISMNFILVRSIRNISYQEWIFPGLMFIIAAVTLIPLLYRDLFDLRINKKTIIPMTLSPISKNGLILGILLSAILESFIFVLIGMSVLTLLMDIHFTWYQYLIILGYLSLFSIFMGTLIVTISLLTDQVTMFIMLLLILFTFLMFGSGVLVEFEFFPVLLGNILRNLPMGMIIRGLRMLVFSGIFDWFVVLIPSIIIVILSAFNAELFRRKLNQ